MADIAVFHSVLGVRAGVLDAGEVLRGGGHRVMIVDQYDGRVFDEYDEAAGFAEQIGYPELMRRAVLAVEELPEGFIAAGFSNGGAMAEYVATRRAVGGVLMLSGALPLAMLGVDSWPAGVPGQIHYAVDDPFREQGFIDAVTAAARGARAAVAVYDYPGRGHLFTDRSLPAEFDAASADLLWQRVLSFCADPAA